MLKLIVLVLFLLTRSGAAHSRLNDPIAIVGAGISGLSSAYHLAEAGHTNITIYEATTRPGGYITSVRYKNVTYDMSAYGVTPIYWKFKAFAEGLGFSFCPLQVIVVLPTSPPAFINGTTYYASFSVPTLPDPTQYSVLLLEQVTRYTELWSFLFEIPFLNERLETDRLFPPKPLNKEKLQRLSLPMLTFLRREKLELLIPILKFRTDTQAYGPIETTAAIYYMTWCPPSLLLPAAQSYITCGKGLGDIVQAMVKRLQRSGKVMFQYGSRVTQVKRGRKLARVITDDGSVDRYSSIIVTSKLENKVRKNVVTAQTSLETRASRKMEDLELYSVMLEGSREESVGNNFLLNFAAKPLFQSRPKSGFWGAAIHELRDPDGPFHSDMSTIVKIGYWISYRQRAMRKPVRISKSAALRRVINGMSRLDSTPWRPIQGYRYKNYFQRWRPKSIREGLPWVLEESQGIGNVYHVNSAACGFESIAHLFDCSERIAKQIHSRD